MMTEHNPWRTRQRIRLAVAVLATVTIAGTAYYNIGKSRAAGSTWKAQYRAGQRVFATLEMRPLAALSGDHGPPDAAGDPAAARDGIARLLRRAEVNGAYTPEGGQPPDAERAAREAELEAALKNGLLDSLLKEAAGFMEARFVNDDVDRYLRWMRDNGYTLKTGERWTHPDGWRAYYEYHTGLTASPGTEMEVAFRESWAASQTEEKFAAGRPVSVAAPPAGVSISVGYATANVPFIADTGSDQYFPTGHWSGGVSAGCPLWHGPPRTQDELLNRFGRVIKAQIAAIFEFEYGVRHPLKMTWIYDPIDDRWWIRSVGVSNFSNMETGFCIVY